MEKRFPLAKYGKRLWTRVLAREIRLELVRELGVLRAGDCLVIDMKNVETFDYSFANELFGRTILDLPHQYPGVFLLVDNMSEYAKENLENALSCIGLVIIDRSDGRPKLLGKVHPADEETFSAITRASGPVTAASLREQLRVGVTAINERLSKLSSLGLVRREKSASAAGREQYCYYAPT
jgi:STAS-like domain of unknown function (DUF4325)